jgi:cyclopropane fatty-acyl-phospholipid synthase-like methyltransferase
VREGDVMKLEQAGVYDAALAIDLLHHLCAEQHQDAIAALQRSLRPGGACLIKDIATTPRWQFLWNRLHDQLVTGRASIHCRSPEEMARVAQAQGFEVEGIRRLARASPYPHYLLLLRKAAASTAIGERPGELERGAGSWRGSQ